MLKFDSESHTYTLGGRTLPSVTGILKNAGLIDTRFYTDEARLRGSYVHKAIHLYLIGKLDENTIDPIIKPYFDAFLDWKWKCNVEVIQTEKIILHRALGYAGALDLLVKMSERNWLLDVKSGSMSPWAAIQTAGYFMAENDVKPTDRAALLLKANGKWKFEPFTNPNDLRVFQAAVTLENFKLGRL